MFCGAWRPALAPWQVVWSSWTWLQLRPGPGGEVWKLEENLYPL